MKKNNRFPLLALILITSLGLILSLTQFQLPQVVPAEAPDTVFSAERASTLIEQIASQPHPSGSAVQQHVQTFLIAALDQMGFHTAVQSTTGVLLPYQAAGNVENITARLPGTDSTGALLLIAHYDSVAQGPGAGDNASGVAVILESLRALRDQMPLKNDLIILFTDAEEYGTLGAQAFTEQHPWMDEVQVALNIEGVLHGKVVLVETGPENGWFVRHFNQAAPNPSGFSWLYELFGMMPNLTDFMPFRQAGKSGGNLFAFNGGTQYHTPRDTAKNIDPRSLQDHGEQTLALIQHFGSIDLSQPHAPNRVYFSLPGGMMIHYPASLALPAALILLLAYAFLVWRMICRKTLTLKGWMLQIALTFALWILLAVTILGAWCGICALFPQFTDYYPAHFYHDQVFLVALIALQTSGFLLLNRWQRNRWTWQEGACAHLFWMMLFSLATSLLMPGFSYLFMLPSVFLILYLFIYNNSDNLTLTRGWLLGISGASALLIWVPMIMILYFSTSFNFLIAIVLALNFLFGFLIPQAEVFNKHTQIITSFVCGILALVLLIIGGMNSTFTPEQPQLLRIEYFLNVDSEEAHWIHPNDRLTEWQRSFSGNTVEKTPWSSLFPPYQSMVYTSSAPAYNLSAPDVTTKVSSIDSGSWQVDLDIIPARISDQLVIAFPPNTALAGGTVNGLRAFAENYIPPADGWITYYYAVPTTDGARFSFQIDGSLPDEILVAERSVGLETIPGLDLAPRPPEIISLGDYVYVSRSVTLIP